MLKISRCGLKNINENADKSQFWDGLGGGQQATYIVNAYASPSNTKKIATMKVITKNGIEPKCDYVSPPNGCWGRSISNNEYVKCTVKFYDSNDDLIVDENAKIKIRGNASAYTAKKPYKLKMDTKQDFGNGFSAKKWILLKGGTDLRFLFANWVSTYYGMEWQPTFQFINLEVNGEKKGCYLLVESVENIEKRLDMDGNGFLIENDAYWWNADKYFKVDGQMQALGFTFKYPDSDDVTDEQYVKIQNYMNATIGSIKDVSSSDYYNYLDPYSFASWYLANEFFCNTDTGGSNMYWYKVSDNGLLKLGPTWDYDSNYYGDINDWSSIHKIENNYGYYFFEKEDFKKIYRNIFLKKLNLVEDLKTYVNSYLDVYGDSIQQAWEDDDARWNSKAGSVENQKNEFFNWYEKRFAWIDNATKDWSLDFSEYTAAVNEANAYDKDLYENYDDLKNLLNVDVYTLDFTQPELDKLTRKIRYAIRMLRLRGSLEEIKVPGTPYKTENSDLVYDISEPHVVINQVYGSGSDEAFASNSFIELYNPSDDAVDMFDWSLQYRSADGEDSEHWQKHDLDGTIPAHSSYLIKCDSSQSTVENAYHIDRYDEEWSQSINSKGISVVLMDTNDQIADDSKVYDNDNKKPVISGYVEMLGVSGEDGTEAKYYEGGASKVQSEKATLKRIGFRDTDSNTVSGDFQKVDYSFDNQDYIKYIAPRCSEDGEWYYNESNIPKYKVEFISDGKVIDKIEVPYTGQFARPSDPEKSGYKFVDWYADESLISLYDFSLIPTADVKLYARWEKTEEKGSSEETPSEEKPSEEVPSEEKPSEEKPSEEIPSEEIPSEEKPSEEKPPEEKPSEEKPSEEKPSEEKPSEEKPSEEKPSEEKSSEEAPSEEAPSEEIPSDDSEEKVEDSNKSDTDSYNRYSAKVTDNGVVIAKSNVDISELFTQTMKSEEYDSSARHRFEVSSKRIARVTRQGILKPKRSGEIDICLKQKNKGGEWTKIGGSIHLTVQVPKMIRKDAQKATKGTKFDASRYLSGTTYAPTRWESTNESVATVDDSGIITVVGKGKTQIIAVYGEGKGSSKKKYKTSLRVTLT